MAGGQGFVVVVFLAMIVARLYIQFDFGKTLDAETHGCELLSPDVLAVEDLVEYSKGVFIGGAGDVISVADNSPEETEQGYLVVVDATSGTPTVTRINVTNFPQKTLFHPHGLFFSKKTNRLYVVNHLGASNGGSRVDMFNAVATKGSLQSFDWMMAVENKHGFPNVGINSVVEGADDEIYITQWKNFNTPQHGAHHPTTLLERVQGALEFVITFASSVGFTGVHRCTFDTTTKSTTMCERTSAWNFVHCNGLAINQDRTKMFVTDPIKKTLYMYDRDTTTSSLIYTGQLELPWIVDNVHVDDVSGDLHLGSIPLAYTQLNKTTARAGRPGTFVVVSTLDTGEYQITEPMLHHGMMLSQISACARLTNLDGDKAWTICGSPHSNGILCCPLV